MNSLPVVSGRDVVKALQKAGYVFRRQTASHIILARMTPRYQIIPVPDHDSVAKGTLRSIIRHAGLTVDEFVALL